MSVRIDLEQVKIVKTGPVYRVENSVTYARGISKKVFVHNTETGEFEHVASVYDMENYPESRTNANNNAISYYRDSVGYKEFENVQIAEDFTEYTYQRIVALIRTYEQAVESFEGTITHSITS